MSDQLQVAVGLREAVRRWCLPVANVPATSSIAPGASRCFKGTRNSDVRFLDQLLLLQPLSAAEAPPLPVHLFQEGTGNAQDSRFQVIIGEATTPNSCSGASTFRSTLGDSIFLSRSHSDERDYSVEGGHLPFHMHQPCNDISSFGSRALPPAEGPQGPLDAEGLPVASQAKPQGSVPQVQQILPTDGPPAPEDNGCVEEKPLERPSALATSQKRQERLAAAASAGPASAPTAAAGATTAERPRRQQHQQQQPLQTFWQLRSCAASSLAAKGIKRRPEPLVGSQLLSRGAMQNGPPAAAMPAPCSGGSGSTRAEGPPQKRQAVARRRADAAPVTRVTRCNSCSSAKPSVPGTRFRRDTAAGRGHTAGEEQSTSCRLRLGSNEAVAKPKQQSLSQHQQQKRSRQLKADDSSVSAAAPPATRETSGDANRLPGGIACAVNQERTDALAASGGLGGDDGAADAAGGAVAALRSNSSSSSIDDPIAAFAIEWLLGCEKRLRVAAGPPAGTVVSSNMETPTQRARAALSHQGSRSGSSGELQRLQATKKRLKQELKAYNSAFATHFGRQPLKQDKEPLRPVYMHYQLIKQLIDQLSPGAQDCSVTVAADSPSAAPARTPSGAATIAQPGDSSCIISRKTTESDKGVRKGRSARMKEGITASPSPTGARRQVNGGGGLRSPVQAKTRERSSQLTAYERQQQMQKRREEMTAQLHQLQRDRRVLGDKLAAYHHRFKQEHGRPLRLKTDIAPVQHEYNLFVETTKQIEALAYALQKQTI